MNLYDFFKFLFFIFFLFFLKEIVSSQSQLTTKDYNCFVALTTKLNTLQYIPYTTYYDFCTPSSFLYAVCNGNSTKSINTKTLSINPLSPSDFSCFDGLEGIYLEDLYLTSTFFNSTEWPASLNELQIRTSLPNGIPFSKPFKTITFYNLLTKFQPTTTIPFSWYANSSAITIYPDETIEPTSSSFLIYFENDLSINQIFKPSFFRMGSKNFPSFYNVGGNIFILLLPSFDSDSLINNIKTIGSLLTIEISSKDNVDAFFIGGLNSLNLNSNLDSITLNMKLSTSQMIDISNSSINIKAMIFKNFGHSFSLNGKIPIIFPKNLYKLQFQDGFIMTFDFLDYKTTNLNTLVLVNNSMSGTLPSVWDTSLPSLQILALSNNNLSGTIDSNYCKLNLIIDNNNFNGLIPSCFTCFFGVSTILDKSAFSGNKFSNFDNPPPCTTIIPNLVFSKTILEGYMYEFYIHGQDLGGSNIIDYISIQPKLNLNIQLVIVPNRLIKMYYYGGNLNQIPKIFELIYPSPLKNFTLSWDPLQPQISNVSWAGNTLVFSGSYFSYNSSIIDIDVGGFSKCVVTSTTFYEIICQISSIPVEETDIITYVKVGDLTTQITLVQNIMNIVLNCSTLNDCNNNGYCNTRLSQCICNSNYEGADCSFKNCPVFNDQTCNGASEGSCNNKTGECTCINYSTVNCGPIECLDPLCGGNGECNKSEGECVCQKSRFTGVNCTTPLHSISSVNPSSTNGGICSINGWFSDVHNNLNILIGSENCPMVSINQSTIICNAPPGQGLQSITVTQNNIIVTAPKMYQYYVPLKSCSYLNDCTSPNNGKCNTATGYCDCINNWYGPSCNLYNGNEGDGGNLPKSNTSIDPNTGSTNINNQQTNYQLSIISLLEIDFSGNTVFNYPLQSNWTTSNKSLTTEDGNLIYTFTQKIGNKNSTIIYKIEEVLKNKQFSFAGIQFNVEGGSIKMAISIENYEFSNNLNTLQIQMKSSVNTLSNIEDVNNCNNENVEIGSIESGNSLSFISIKKDGKILNGRFLDHVISDGKSTFMTTTLVSKSDDEIIVGMNLPHAETQCSIDPDFSVLISPDFKSNCNDNKKPWLIPVVVIIPVVGVFAIGAAVIVIYRKNQIDPYLLKLKNLNKQKS